MEAALNLYEAFGLIETNNEAIHMEVDSEHIYKLCMTFKISNIATLEYLEAISENYRALGRYISGNNTHV
jgi:hypothetical protein